MKKKLLAFLLSFIMLSGSMAGCSNGTENPVDTESNQNSETAAVDDTELETLDIFINFPWYRVDSFTGIIPELIKEKTGVDLNVTIATDSNQLGVMIGSGEIPDIVFTDVELERLSNSSLCYSYTELEENYGASFSEAREEAVNIARSLSADDDYYTLLTSYNTAEEWAELQIGAPGQACILYRKDLLDKMGSPEINTVEDLMTVMEQCKTEYPDMIPFGLGAYWKFQALSAALGVPAYQYDLETGTYFYEASSPSYKEYLKTTNKMARNGYVTAEAYANENQADAHQLAYNNGCIFYSWYLNYSNLIQLQTETKAINPEAEWAVLPMLGDNGTVGKSRGWAGTFVSKNCSNPEAAARLLTFLQSEEGRQESKWGRKDIDYTLDENGVPQFSEEFISSRSDGTFDEKYNGLFSFGKTAIDEIYSEYSGLDEEILEPFTSYGVGYKNYPEVGIAQPLTSSDEGIIFTKMEELKKSYEAKVIFTVSDEEFENGYQEYMEALEKTGLNVYNDYMTKTIKEVKTNLGLK